MPGRISLTTLSSLCLTLVACTGDVDTTEATIDSATEVATTGEATSAGSASESEPTGTEGTTTASDDPTSTSTAGETTTSSSTTADEITGTSTAGETTTSTSTTSDDTSTAGETTTTGTAGDTMGDDTGSGALLCPESIDAAILACVADLQADPELAAGNFLLDLLLMCGDAEPVAGPYDAHCASEPADPICGLEYPEFVETVLPECIARAQEVLFADVCLFPEQYSELLFAPAIALMDRRFVTDAGQLSAIEQQQIVAASADMGFAAGTIEEALLATDDGGFEQLTVLDVGTDRVLVAYTAHYGDTRVGRVFFRGTLTIVGAIEDGFFTRCAVERAIEGQPCVSHEACAPDHMCLDILTGPGDEVVAPGTCVWPAGLPGEGATCTTHDDCDPTSGLLCLDNIAGGEGMCRPGWMRRSFPVPTAALVTGGLTSIPIAAAGVATVPNRAYLDLQLYQVMSNAIAVRVVNPFGTPATVSTTDAASLELELAAVGVPSDESAGGLWQLVVADIGGAASGGVLRGALTLDTRWD